jgi:hypothetical protein
VDSLHYTILGSRHALPTALVRSYFHRPNTGQFKSSRVESNRLYSADQAQGECGSCKAMHVGSHDDDCTYGCRDDECTVLERRDVRFDLNITSRLTVGTRGSSSRSAIKYPSSSGQPEYCELF